MGNQSVSSIYKLSEGQTEIKPQISLYLVFNENDHEEIIRIYTTRSLIHVVVYDVNGAAVADELKKYKLFSWVKEHADSTIVDFIRLKLHAIRARRSTVATHIKIDCTVVEPSQNVFLVNDENSIVETVAQLLKSILHIYVAYTRDPDKERRAGWEFSK